MSDGPRSRFRTAVFIAVFAVAVAVLIHLDWHVGRPRHMRYSLDWDFHWVLGLGAGIGMALIFVRRFGSGKAGPALLVTGMLGFLLGQIVQPALEAIGNSLAFGTVNPPVRWSVFAGFSIAWLAGSAVVLALALRRASAGRAETDPT